MERRMEMKSARATRICLVWRVRHTARARTPAFLEELSPNVSRNIFARRFHSPSRIDLWKERLSQSRFQETKRGRERELMPCCRRLMILVFQPLPLPPPPFISFSLFFLCKENLHLWQVISCDCEKLGWADSAGMSVGSTAVPSFSLSVSTSFSHESTE